MELVFSNICPIKTELFVICTFNIGVNILLFAFLKAIKLSLWHRQKKKSTTATIKTKNKFNIKTEKKRLNTEEGILFPLKFKHHCVQA